jgi:DNA-damage-inducible protein J
MQLQQEATIMTTTNLNIRVQPEIKEKVKEVLSEYGLDMSTAVNIFFRKVIATHGIPFDLRPETPNIETVATMLETEEIVSRPSTRKSYDSFTHYLNETNSDV